jgi:hypothetical protein
MNLAHRRLAAQRLVGRPFPTIDEAVRAQCAVQAQDYPGAAWGIGQRVAGTTLSDVNEALAAGTILRTHVLRPTWHLVSPIDIRWLLQLTGPRVVAGAASRYRNLELDTRTLARSADIVERELGGGRHRTRTELGAALAEAGIEASGGRLAHILMHAELTALVCSGAPRGAQQTYALLDERAPSGSPLDRDEALARLAERFATTHSPFRDIDLAWWGGITLGDARRALGGSHLERQTIGEHEYWRSLDVPEVEPRPTIHVLPNFDEYVVAYRDRIHVFDGDAIAARTFLRDYLSTHLVVADGRAIGRWRRPTGGRSDIELEWFGPVEGIESRLETALGAYASFDA